MKNKYKIIEICKKHLGEDNPTCRQDSIDFETWVFRDHVLAAIDEIIKQEQDDYLNDCIKRATPHLSKIKDVDKFLDEIRGTEPDKEIIKALSGEKIEDVKTITSTDYPPDIQDKRAEEIPLILDEDEMFELKMLRTAQADSNTFMSNERYD